jgi:peptidoglycan/LPS O-acetylase OafA/YrhL
MLSPGSSLRISLLRFPLIVGVVFIHNYEATVGFTNGTMAIGLSQNNFVSEFIRYLISHGIAGLVVPTFFLMSGYLFLSDLYGRKKTLSVVFL